MPPLPMVQEPNPVSPASPLEASASGQPSAEDIQQLIQQFMVQSNQSRTQMLQSRAEMQNGQALTQKQALRMLESAGINPVDPSSFQRFLQNLEQTDPDAAELFRNALSSIFPEEAPVQNQATK